MLLLIGSGDLLIPSAEEGPRLQKALPRARLKVPGSRSAWQTAYATPWQNHGMPEHIRLSRLFCMYLRSSQHGACLVGAYSCFFFFKQPCCRRRHGEAQFRLHAAILILPVSSLGCLHNLSTPANEVFVLAGAGV